MLGKTLLACATFAVAAVAQGRIAFTVLPTNVTAGQPVQLQWGGGDSSAVTLTLQQGTINNLQTVQLITGSATGNSYTWIPSTSLPNAENYALKIQQGENEPNYSGMITLTGGQTSGPTVAVSALASASSAASSTTSSVPTNPASGGVVGGGSSSGNGTSTAAGNATTTAAAGTGAVGSGSAATGTAMSRNSTMSMATLTSSSSSSTSSSSAAATSSGSSTGTSTSSGPAPSSSKSAAVTLAASNFALLCAAVVGIAYLG